MIKALSNCDEVVLIVREVIATQAGLPSDYVLNGETHQGAKLGHVVDNKIIPFNTSDTFIVFDLTEDSELSRTQVLEDDTIDCFTYYRMKFTIYGDLAGTISQKLRARMTTAKVRQSLESEGVHIESFEPINSMNEYINNIYWQRKDLELVLSCRFNFTQYDTDEDMENMNTMIAQVNTEFARVVKKTLVLSRQSSVDTTTLKISADVPVEEKLLSLTKRG